jgi:hypothetical protein
MSTSEILEQLRRLTIPERLRVIESATRLIQEDLSEEYSNGAVDDPILRVAGCLSGDPISAEEIEKELYGEG